ncbi:diacylglycerol lipase-alpha-like isoform X2 [Watersipora subatra]|uniref:diacylglycerol lipase-alpha-like isoform X2 n=1 Tax=Watersipora subatra TaxID=2589382 RepID=UPI00355BB597
MPGLVVFRRRWSIGSDDLILPAVGLAFLNIIWLLALAVLLLYIYTSCGPDEETCLQKFIWYPGTTMVLQLVLLAVHVAIAVQSGRGGVLDTEARKHLPCYCYIRAGLLVVELVWFCAGCGFLNWKLTSGHCRSTDFVYILMCVVVGANVVILFLTILATYLSFDSAGRTFWRLQELQNCTDDARRSALVRKLEARYRQKCMNRVNLAFCCESVSKPSDKKVFEDIALLMASYLDHLDLVLSDFLAGMKLLRLQQKALFTEAINQSTNDIYQYLSGTPISPRTKFLTLKDCKTKNELECMTYFAEYAVASYGWQGQYFFYPTKACCSINVCCRCEGCARWVNDLDFTGDNCCQCQYTAIAAGSPLVSEEDFIYGNYDNETNFPSYFVCLDHKYKKVLLCIRGTMSISDAAIDLQGDMKEIPVEPRQPSWLGHAGMVTSASNVYSDLAEKEVLKRAFNRCQGSDYQLLIIGHSLGAGVAPIIAFILQEQYPQLYCYSYSPPGGLLSLDAVEESKKFTTSIVIGKDIIPRLGTAQLEYFRSDLLALLEDCKEPKWKIIFSGWPLIGRCLNVKENMTLPRARSQDYNPFQPNTHSSVHTHLYPPGCIIHIVKNYPKDSGKDQKPMYQAIWSDNKSFDTIIVSPKMVEDHMPNTVLDAMKNVLAHHGPKKPSKVLTEEERQAILQEDEGADHHSHTSAGACSETVQVSPC